MKMARRGPGRDPDDTAPRLTEEVHMTAPNVAAKWSTWAPRLLSVLRIFTAFIFIQAGTMKLFAFPMGMPPNGATATPLSEFWIAGVLETVGGPFLLLGLFTRPIAFVLAGEMAVAYFQDRKSTRLNSSHANIS